MIIILIILAIYVVIGLLMGIYIAINEKVKLLEKVVLVIISTFVWGIFLVKLFFKAIKNGYNLAQRTKFDNKTF